MVDHVESLIFFVGLLHSLIKMIPIDVNESFQKESTIRRKKKFVIKLTLTSAGTLPDQNFHRSRIILAK